MDPAAIGAPVELLEREHEVEHVRAALRAAGKRGGAAVVIEGAAGLGKSRLLELAGLQASELGFRLLTARATELEQGFPFGVVRQLFERALLQADVAERERWLDRSGGPGRGSPHRRAVIAAAVAGTTGGRPQLRVATRPVLAGRKRLV